MEGWEEIEDFANERKTWLKKFINLSNGVPSHDTFRRVFNKLDPKLFQACFIRWVDGLRSKTSGEIIAIDGKTVRGSVDKANGRSAIHMVSAWACENQLVLGQLKVADKSNEITAIPELLDALFIEDSVITIDAMGCQKSIAEKIREKKADYLLAVKNNHKQLYKEIEATFSDLDNVIDKPYRYSREIDGGHGRIEQRTCYVASSRFVEQSLHWKDAKSVVMLESVREYQGKKSTERRFYITSLNSCSQDIAKAIRSHWGIENSLHWCLDVAFNEDKCKIRTDYAPENLSTVRRIVLNILKHDKTRKIGLERKRRMAAINIDYMEKVICQYN
jgi:predicted transposase YbfD/YdcC